MVNVIGVFSTEDEARTAKRNSMLEILEYHDIDIVNMEEESIDELSKHLAKLEKDLKNPYDMENSLEVRIEEKIIDNFYSLFPSRKS